MTVSVRERGGVAGRGQFTMRNGVIARMTRMARIGRWLIGNGARWAGAGRRGLNRLIDGWSMGMAGTPPGCEGFGAFYRWFRCADAPAILWKASGLGEAVEQREGREGEER
jgi:hypothetical protein